MIKTLLLHLLGISIIKVISPKPGDIIIFECKIDYPQVELCRIQRELQKMFKLSTVLLRGIEFIGLIREGGDGPSE